MRLPCVDLEVSQLCWFEENLNHVLKIDGDESFKDLLTNEIFSRQILSWNFNMKFWLNMGLVWGFLGWKLIIIINHVLRIDGDELFKDLLTNKIFSRKMLSWNFKMKLCLNRGLVWEFLGWKLIFLTTFFCKIKTCFILLKFWAQTWQ